LPEAPGGIPIMNAGNLTMIIPINPRDVPARGRRI
jgi:hypothetical protein